MSLEDELGGIPGLIGFDDFLGVKEARAKAGVYGLIDSTGGQR